MVRRFVLTFALRGVSIALALTGIPTLDAAEPPNAGDALRTIFVHQPQARTTSPTLRSVTARDLLELRDIAGLSVSPDGRYVAFQVQQVDLEANGFHAGWFVAEIKPSTGPTYVGSAGEPIWLSVSHGRNPGAPFVLTARWSPDSQWIAYLCRERSVVQVCRSRRDSGRRERLTELDADVEDLAWTADGSRIIFTVNRGPSEQRMLEDQEGAQGFLLDDRFDVFHSLRPIRNDIDSQSAVRSIRTLELATNAERDASDEEVAWFEAARPTRTVSFGWRGTTRLPTLASVGAKPIVPQTLAAAVAAAAPRYAVYSRDHRHVAWLAPASADKQGLYPPLTLFSSRPADETHRQCSAKECTGLITDAWWRPDNREVLFLKREGWAYNRSALYAWTPDADAIRRITITQDLLTACTATDTSAICFHEAATLPKRIVAIDLRTGRLEALVEPNPQFHDLRIAEAELLEWKNQDGDEAFGYLVKPPGHAGRTRLPLIVVQYRATGFLKGGVGDEYPIQLLASNGFAVLAFDKPNSWTTWSVESDVNTVEAMEWQQLAERRRALSALESGVALLEERGVVDPCRVGITGLSDGAETATFALIHSKRFAAAATSSGGWDPLHYFLESGRRRAALAQRGLGRPGTPEGYNWQHVSLSLNASNVNVPLLVNVSDREVLLMMQLYATFKDLKKPIEVYVFPDEYHQKWQPRHRLHIYQRNVDWFRFWLQGYEEPDPLKRAQYERWRVMKAQAPAPADPVCGRFDSD